MRFQRSIFRATPHQEKFIYSFACCNFELESKTFQRNLNSDDLDPNFTFLQRQQSRNKKTRDYRSDFFPGLVSDATRALIFFLKIKSFLEAQTRSKQTKNGETNMLINGFLTQQKISKRRSDFQVGFDCEFRFRLVYLRLDNLNFYWIFFSVV